MAAAAPEAASQAIAEAVAEAVAAEMMDFSHLEARVRMKISNRRRSQETAMLVEGLTAVTELPARISEAVREEGQYASFFGGHRDQGS